MRRWRKPVKEITVMQVMLKSPKRMTVIVKNLKMVIVMKKSRKRMKVIGKPKVKPVTRMKTVYSRGMP